ncbi:GTP-binding protein Rheb [Cololabis saira]|uniref:GTP-binding protein Rheb n=1 Tax=Cololabis saira TaxID=129043 RepID=UPI002AD210AA|nr:GTP-binding protein Rheb [Cololabis saira]
MMPGGAQGLASFRMPAPGGPSLAPGQGPASGLGPAPGLASANQSAAGEGEQDALSTAQRSMLKWEKEESLGELATVAPVLYCNTNFPQLKLQYPAFTKTVTVNGQEYSLQLVHTAGQDEYSIFPQTYTIDGDGYILIYSVTSYKR